ncbi:glycosyl transferase [Spirosoma taeanense]|uniref:Glycosyl transferase n=1 Tax=Spirosoma taeanense TaxID=2735870 RepID=A0A6M5YEE4_9BACT|nr:glycosyl transferase [Spirosoma taeanense]
MDTRSDEPRRALVALEMMLSGDYVTPTLNGERYFNKPPLYNWIIIASYRLFGNYSSFALRFPMAISLLLFGLTIFGVVRRYMPVPRERAFLVAFVAAMMVLTNGRVLLYDTLLGLIDITFSWLTYSAMMLVFHFDRRRNYWALFLTTYCLTALGFLMKGLPSVVFQGLTLTSWFLYTRQFRRLGHPAHFAGIGLFLLLTGSYYVAYFTRNHIPFTDVAAVLFDESAKRTVVKFGIVETLLHLLTFPFEFLYHFAPYTLLLVLLFRKGLVRTLRAEPFVAFNALVFIVNVLIYWSSPQVYARYLIGLLAPLFTLLAYLYYEQTNKNDRARWWVEQIWLGMALIVTVGCWVALWLPQTRPITGLVWKTALTFTLLSFNTYWLWRAVDNRLGRMLLVMVSVRIGMNLLVLPGRLASREYYKAESERIARRSLGKPLYAYRQTVGSTGATDVNSFHIAALRNEILRKTDQKRPDAYYIADSLDLAGQRYVVIDTLRLFDRHPASLVRFP